MKKSTNEILEKYNEMYEQEVITKINDDTLAEREVDIQVQKGNEVNGEENVEEEQISEEENALLDRVIQEEIDAQDSYTVKAGLVDHPAIADMFKCLAKEELQHQVLLENLRKGEFYTRETPIQTRRVVIEPKDMTENDMKYIEMLMTEEKDAMMSYSELGQKSKSQILQENFVEIAKDEEEHYARLGRALHGDIDVEDVAQELVDLIDDGQKVDVVNKHYEDNEEEQESSNDDINFNQDPQENYLRDILDEVINTNKEKGESRNMTKKLDEGVATEETKKVDESLETENCEKGNCEKECNEKEVCEEKECNEKEECECGDKVEEACVEENACKTEMEDKEEDDDDKEEDKEDKEDDKEEMSKADKKTYEARIATLENNLKAVKAELKVAAPFKALYEEATKKIAELEAYKEDVELDKLKTDKEKYAATCNFDALEDEDKDKVQEKIDDYKFSLYDFKAFMADVLKRYSRKQVYSNMEKIISYFSMNDEEKKADDMELPSDKNQADRILDKYSDVL